MNQKDFTVVITHAIPKPGLEQLFEECRVYYPEHASVYSDAELMSILPAFELFEDVSPDLLRPDSLLREFVGGGIYKY